MVKGNDKLARGRVPEFGGFVHAQGRAIMLSPTCRQDPSTVRTERRMLNRLENPSAALGKRGYGFARSRIPEIGAVMFRACRQHSCTVRAKRRVKARTELFKGSDELARSRVPELGAMIRSCR